jgi:hypothetical protein
LTRFERDLDHATQEQLAAATLEALGFAPRRAARTARHPALAEKV